LEAVGVVCNKEEGEVCGPDGWGVEARAAVVLGGLPVGDCPEKEEKQAWAVQVETQTQA